MLGILNKYLPKFEITQLFPLIYLFGILITLNIFSLGSLISLFDFLKVNEIWKTYIVVVNSIYKHLLIILIIYLILLVLYNSIYFLYFDKDAGLQKLQENFGSIVRTLLSITSYFLYPGWIIYFISSVLNNSWKFVNSPQNITEFVTYFWFSIIAVLSALSIYQRYFLPRNYFYIGSYL